MLVLFGSLSIEGTDAKTHPFTPGACLTYHEYTKLTGWLALVFR